MCSNKNIPLARGELGILWAVFSLGCVLRSDLSLRMGIKDFVDKGMMG